MSYAGSKVTGPDGLIAVDKVGNRIRFYDPHTLREVGNFAAPEPCVDELAISPDHKTAFVPLYGDGIYGANKNPNNKVLAIDLERRELADIIPLGEFVAPHGMVAARDGKLWVVCDIPGKLLPSRPSSRSAVPWARSRCSTWRSENLSRASPSVRPASPRVTAVAAKA